MGLISSIYGLSDDDFSESGNLDEGVDVIEEGTEIKQKEIYIYIYLINLFKRRSQM